MKDIVVRPAAPEDADDLATSVATADYLRRYGASLDSPEAYIKRAMGSGICLSAVVGGKAVGLVWFTDSGTLGRGGYIRLIVVKADFRGIGAGRALMSEAERQIFEHSQHAFLLTSHFNTKAQAFYEKLGWVKSGELPGFVAPDITEFLYWKKRPETE